MMVKLIVSCFALAVVTTQSRAAINLLQNGGFETKKLSPWVQDFDGDPFGTDWSVTNAQYYDGTFSATCKGDKGLVQNFSPTGVANITEVSFAIKDLSPNAVNAIDLVYSDSTATFTYIIPVDTGWHVYDLVSQLDPTKKLSGLRIYGYSGGKDDITFLDNAKVLATPEPASLFALSLGALAFLRRPGRNAANS